MQKVIAFNGFYNPYVPAYNVNQIQQGLTDEKLGSARGCKAR